MPKKYNPNEVEAGRYDQWLDEKVFEPNGDASVEAYSVVIPPPNVTGKLHLGHAWDVTLQDMIVRQKRMQGYDTLWLPGMDHAGIATQAKVEEKLRKEENLSRYDLGREKFIDKTWEWKEEYAQTIRNQWAKMGISVDYNRERFTLDEGLSEAVRKVFVTLYEKGLIYRGEYIINWDPVFQTALSDIEVVYKDDKGAFYHLEYPLADGSGSLRLATTRPETLLGDTAVAVHPDDERYQDYIGKTVILPIVGREIPVISDDYVDRDFGTGVVKITPAHDPNDFAVGNRHNLERINVMNDDGTMNENAGKYQGMTRDECRQAIVEDLKAEGSLVDIEEIVHSVGHSERSDAVVEPRLSTQWFVKMAPLAKQALDNQKTENRVDFYPPRFEQTFVSWMENVHDWVISRQLWWGHQIPAWYHKESGEVYVGMEAPEDEENWVQDPDVLDTWFSSALWPFSTMGWPDEEASDYKRYFPTDTLVTGYDIIFFWVSRMIFQSLEFTGERPFKNVLIHGLIRDSQGRKMSKSLGNGVDPMDVVDQYGADALRWFLATGSTPGQDIRYYPEKLEAAWNFINKIWNASRYALMNLDGMTYDEIDLSGVTSIVDQWILTRLNETIAKVTDRFDAFEFGEAGRALYHFIWNDFCDWYIEMSKEVLQGDDEDAKHTTRSVLSYVLEQMLALLHPIMPFVTEEIWQHIPHQGTSIVTAKYPEVDESQIHQEAARHMEALISFIRSIRTARNENNVAPSKPIAIHVKANSQEILTMLEENKEYINRFANPSELKMALDTEIPDQAMTLFFSDGEIYLPLAGFIDIDEEIQRLESELAKWASEVERVDKKLANHGFVNNAPADLVEKERQKGQDYQQKYQATKERLADLKATN
ncbi:MULTISPECIES: valine--tRNA ligase [Aerococcus]|uniref:Valine--tRNA ligase n=1 Tax=Aerococcus loyolae TaxID=2976809 RepID=A0ABT4BXW9_9LACT|nr:MULTISPECIES: valine--tRNA ligase [Aerococcus]KAA9217965.1 valine--tRNA ligase [Aerococcus loyolae]KAA9266410.1 valine--tRNA ligase [Aerococcus loyolae]MCY3025111.1 valine--tRNA ligase [Aerococcus loyolae]MCY3027232.1 valine--tRNA ligase [Aerococcus loyolae]MCY3029202.1 valine--tRNA ligase [Aerococcus loyolae]